MLRMVRGVEGARGREGKGEGEVGVHEQEITKVNILSIDERQELLNIVNTLASKHSSSILSCCAYGSKISGYARADSDYDILLVLEEYKDLIKYVYMHGYNRMAASILIVDANALLKDAERAMLGEFVIGRLLNPYEPLYNVDYLNKAEVIYKRRVILEELDELIRINPLALAGELLIPLEYFLFSKLKKRAKIYPHAVYSYIKTYTGSNAARNIALSKRGFIDALKELEEEGIIELVMHNDNLYARVLKPPRLNDTFVHNEFLRGAFAWIVHTYAGRKTLNFFSSEARSKLKRRKEIKNMAIPLMLDHPSSLLKVSEGIVIDSSDYIARIAESLGFNGNYTYTLTSMGDKHATTMLCSINSNDGRVEKVVIKRYTDIKIAKWIALNLWLLGIGLSYDVSPYTRMRNEYIGTRRVRELDSSIRTPPILGISFKNRVMVFKYVDGVPLSKMIDELMNGKDYSNSNATMHDTLKYVHSYGSTLALVHVNNFVLRDTKPSNVLISKSNGLCLTDFEQFTTLKSIHDASWDVACFLYYSLLFTKNYDNARIVIREFVDGYREHNSNYKEIFNYAADIKYCLPFYPAITLGMIKVVREELLKVI